MTVAGQTRALEQILANEYDRDRRILISGAQIVTMEHAEAFVGDLLVRGDRIEAIGPDLSPAGDSAVIVDASGCILLPGLIDSHVHAWEGQLRGLAPDADISTYVALTHAGFGPHYRPEDLAIAERLTAAQSINAGTTTIVDNAHNTRTREHGDAAIEALLTSGIRAVFAAGAAQVGEHDHHLPDDLLRLRDEFPVSGDGLVTLRMYDDHPSIQSWDFADRHGFDLSLELGRWTPDVEALARSGRMRAGHTYNHCTGLSAPVWEAIAESGAAINLCPRSDSQFGLGAFAPVLQASHFGIQPGISSDNEIAYGHDLFAEMRTLLTIQHGLRRLESEANPDREVPPRLGAMDALRAATIGGSLNAGKPDEIGSLAPGKRADLVLLSLDDVTTSLWGSVVGTIVGYAGIGTVDAVFIDGRARKWGGDLIGIDYPSLVREGERSRQHLFEAFGTSLDRARIGLTDTVDTARADAKMRSFVDQPGY